MQDRRYDSRVDTHQHIQEVQRRLAAVVVDIVRRSNAHDQSKLQSPECEAFDEYTPKLATTTYGSEEYERYRAAMGPALDHHYAHNSHHPEHYCWRCPICQIRLSEPQASKAPEGPNDSGVRYCPCCSKFGIIYESELMREPKGIRGMSLLDVLEMLCDWKAATLRHKDGDILRSIEHNQKRFGYSDDLKQILLNTLPLIEAA